MNEDQHQERTSIGAYVLGHLGADEARWVEAHLDACDACRAEYAELLPVSAALSQARAARSVVPPLRGEEPPTELGERVLAAVAAERTRENRARWRRRGTLGGAAAAAAAAILVAGIWWTRPAPPPTVPLEAVAVEAQQPGVEASADLIDHTWGIEVKLTATGFGQGDRYLVRVIGEDGRAYPAGGFVGTGSREMLCNLTTSLPRDRAAGFEVRDRGGRLVVSSEFAT